MTIDPLTMDGLGTRREVARWTHLWASAARQIEQQMHYDPHSPASSIGALDALTLAVVDAVHNTYRGACAAIGADDPAVKDFERAVPKIKDLRNRLEHFDAYLRGEGFAQKEKGRPPLALGASVGLTIPESSGGPGGHAIIVKVQESNGETIYELQTGTTVMAARRLARSVVQGVGLDDDRHRRCTICLP